MNKIGGLDIGRTMDSTAYFGIENKEIIEGIKISTTRFTEQRNILRPLLMKNKRTLVDVTGIGLGMFESMQESGIPNLVAVLIVFGDKCKITDKCIVVGKKYLMITLADNLMDYKFNVNNDLWQETKNQLMNFVVKPGKTEKFEAKSGHDDLVIALALAVLGDVLYGEGRCDVRERTGIGTGERIGEGFRA